MNTVKMPGFTAEMSIYKALNHYHAVAAITSITSNATSPAGQGVEISFTLSYTLFRSLFHGV